jgi:hypothetical protein
LQMFDGLVSSHPIHFIFYDKLAQGNTKGGVSLYH